MVQDDARCGSVPGFMCFDLGGKKSQVCFVLQRTDHKGVSVELYSVRLVQIAGALDPLQSGVWPSVTF